MDDQFIQEFMEATNVYRKRHGVDKLVYNPEISKISQMWADKLIKMKTIKHQDSPKYKGVELGENIATAFDSRNTYYSGHVAVGQWYSEVANYNFRSHTGSGTGHFTQLVWKGSKEVGAGKAQDRNGKWIVVANYYPAGNFIGRYQENVFPPAENKTSLYDPSGAPGNARNRQASGDAPEEACSNSQSVDEMIRGFDFQSGFDRENFESSRISSGRSTRGDLMPDVGNTGRTEKSSTRTSTKLYKDGNNWMVQETTTTTTISGGTTSTKTRTKTRTATKEDLQKFGK